jgi:hypothetical protein
MRGDEMIKDSLGAITGRVVVRTYPVHLEPKIKELFGQGLSANQIADIMPADSEEVANLIVNKGRQLIWKLLNGGATVGLKYLSIGTGTTAPALADTQLQTESFRKLITSFAYDNTTIYCDTFLAAAEANFTWQEVGMHGNSTAGAGANSGDLFSHALLNQVKSSTQTKTVSWQITASQPT